MTENSLPPLTWLRAFEASARHLSFTQAAGELNLTQSAVSQHVRSLESYLGRELFIRRTRALNLTEDGANYLPVVQEAFDILAVGTRAFRGSDRGQRLMINCNMAFSIFWLAPRLAELLSDAPWLTLNIVTPIWDPERSAAASEVEVRFGRAASMPKGAFCLSKEEAFPVAAPFVGGDAPDWQHQPLFDCAGVVTGWEAWLSAQKLQLPKGKAISLASTYVVAMTAAQHAAGLAMSHDTLAGKLLQSGGLVAPYAFRIPMAEAYFLLETPRHEETPASRVFNRWIKQRFAREGASSA